MSANEEGKVFFQHLFSSSHVSLGSLVDSNPRYTFLHPTLRSEKIRCETGGEKNVGWSE